MPQGLDKEVVSGVVGDDAALLFQQPVPQGLDREMASPVVGDDAALYFINVGCRVWTGRWCHQWLVMAQP